MARWQKQKQFSDFPVLIVLWFHRFSVLICNLFIMTTTIVASFDLRCLVEKDHWKYLGDVYQCKGQSVYITSKYELTSVNGRSGSTTLKTIFIDGQTVHYLPKGIGGFFPNLIGLAVYSSKLKSLTQDDMKTLTQLINVSFWDNDLEHLDSDVFDFNPNIKRLSFGQNKLKHVGGNLLSNLRNLQNSYFNDNLCIDSRSSSDISGLISKLKSQCNWCREHEYIKKIERLNSEILALKAENTIQANSVDRYARMTLE